MTLTTSDFSVDALRQLSRELLESVEGIEKSTKELENVYHENAEYLGVHAESLGTVIDDVKATTLETVKPVNGLSELVLEIATAIEEYINYDPFKDILDSSTSKNRSAPDVGSGSRVSEGTDGSSGGGESASGTSRDPMAGVKRIEGSHTVAGAVMATNPNYDRLGFSRQYNHNCQRCVPAYEARRRGYDVTAKPIPIPDPHELGKGHNWVSMYKDPVVIACSGNGKQDIINQMKSWGEGARAEIGVEWGFLFGGGGHVFVAEVINGEVYFLDPQTGNLDCSSYFRTVKSGTAELVRIDNLEFTDVIKECFM